MKTKLLKLLAVMTISITALLALGITASAETVGAFEVTGGTNGTDYTYENGVLTINTSTALTIKNTNPSTPTTDRIEVATGISANITLAGVNIDVSATENTAAFKIADNSTGNVTITLADGKTNTLKSGTNCAGLQKNGGTSTGMLTIQGETAGTGTLTATGGESGAGIGGGYNGNGSNIEISGGKVTAKGGEYSAGIGGGDSDNGGDGCDGSYITISGGEVTATGGNSSAGIGGGGEGSGSYITISGGEVTATGGEYGAGIGGGFNGNGSNIEISGGKVTATGGDDGAGIGSGDGGSGSYITISGGEVTAQGGYRAAGIGGGWNGNGSNIEISGSVVTAQGGDGGAGIGGGFKGNGSNIEISGGSVKAVAGTVHQNCVPATIGQGVQYDINTDVYSNGAEVTPTDGNDNVYLTDNAYLLELDVDGTSAVTINGKAYPTKHIDENKLYVYLPAGNYTVANGNSQKLYTIADDGTVSEVAVGTAFTITGTDPVLGTDYTYPADTGVLTILSSKAVTIANADPSTPTTDTIVVADGVSANITLAGVNIDVSATWHACAFKIANDSTGNVTITLADGTTNTLESGGGCAGLQKNGAYISETQGKLTITGTGTLTATGGDFGAGIGGGYEDNGSNIEISGGVVTAIGGGCGAGIGGGNRGSGSYIEISGGTVTATGVDYGAGIGGGSEGSGSNIKISGGTVTATGGEGGAGIGGGIEGNGSNIKISGGSVKAVAGERFEATYFPAAIGQGVQYNESTSVYSNGAEVTPTDGTDNVYLLELAVDGTSDVTINGKAYPKKHFDENKVYIYLPAKTAQAPNEVTVGNETTKYIYDTANSKWLVVGVVDAPTFTPASGTTFTSTQNVTIACATDGATIYYTTDGSTPTTASTKYTGAITITSTTTIKAIAVKDGMGDSSVVTAKYTKNSGGSGGSGGGSGGSGGGSSSSSDESPNIEGKNGKKGWSAISDVIEDTKEGEKVVIDMNDATELPKNILKEIKGKDITIVLNMDNGFIWTINGKDVENSKTIDMGVKKGTRIPVKVINEVTGESEYIEITLSHNGDFGFKAVLTVDMGKNNKGNFANLYYYNGKEMDIICSDEIDENGKADLTFTHASEYVIVIDDTDHTDLSAGESIKVEEIVLL